MALWSVHLPRALPPEAAAERAVLVRDGFAFWAVVFGPLWFLRHREWLGLVGWLVLAALIRVAAPWLGPVVTGGLQLVLIVATGVVANDVRRLTLALRGFAEVGVVEGLNREAAERRFFEAWLVRRPAPPPAPVAPAAHPATRRVMPGVLGLLPDSGARG